MPVKNKNGWSCSVCTFLHSAPAPRCSMCHALRVSKQQMADFIHGIPIPKDNNNNNNNNNSMESSSSSNKRKNNHAKEQQQQQHQQQSSSSPIVAQNPAKRQRPTEPTTLMLNTAAAFMENHQFGTIHTDGLVAVENLANDDRPSHTAAAAATVDTSVTGDGAQPPQGNHLRATVATFPPPPPANRQQQLKPPLQQQQKQLQQQQKRRAQRQQPHPHNQNRASSLAMLPFSPGPVPFHPETARDWIFPVCATTTTTSNGNDSASGSVFAKRQYQLDICATAVRHNTLVSLPTGLGKTLIAAVVLYNYHRWFPRGKVIFMATTLPLVQQQVQACYDVMGISVHDTAVLTGKMSPERRLEIWSSKTVFFCTPQTVQNDLEKGRLDATSIVCIVLDEAHKARGDYAYCKIIQHLLSVHNNTNNTTTTDSITCSTNADTENKSNNINTDITTTTIVDPKKKNALAAATTATAATTAKFRILGLSATPGATIQEIQDVMNALCINKVEARCDDDVDVKKYIHEREYEVIIVPQVSACRNVERLLNEMIGPMLDDLRRRGGFKERGNATVSAYRVLQAIDVYNATHGKSSDPLGVRPLLYAAHHLMGIRAALNSQGIGVVRSKLLQLQNEPQRGLLKSIVRKPAFQALWDLVARSTCSNYQSSDGATAAAMNSNLNTSIADKLMNNPKLVKLREILTVHFEQARATGQSSRAIVFEQYRDCVGEILFVLKDLAPLIRARPFVGQKSAVNKSNNNNNSGGGGGDITTDENAVQQVKGMKQAEQHAALRQFRENVFNVLVCTSIGEEGLDISEVDLIVNFDTTRSPVRSIQRMGRTGRKRDGRVVWLVSEGEEERAFKQNKQRERTLVHALRNPNSFSVVPTVPMLPNDPVLCEKSMNVAVNAHMSQVEGHAEQGKKKKPMKTKPQQQPRQSSVAGAGETGVATTKTASATTTQRKSWRLSSDAQARRASVLGMSNRISTYSMAAMKRRIIIARRQQQQHQSTNRSSRATLARYRLGRTTSLLCQFEENNNIMQQAARVAGFGRSSDLSLDAFFPLTSGEDHFTKLAWGSVKAPPPRNPTAALMNTDSSCLAKAPNTSRSGARSEEAALAVSHGGATVRETSQVMTAATRPAPSIVVNPYNRAIPTSKQVVNPYNRAIPTSKQQVPSQHGDMDISNMAVCSKNNGSSMLPAVEEFRLPTPEPSSGEESSDDDDDDGGAPCAEFVSDIAVMEPTGPSHPCAGPETDCGIVVDLNDGSMIGQVESAGFPPHDAITDDNRAAAFLSLNEHDHHVAEAFASPGCGGQQVLDEVATSPLQTAAEGAAGLEAGELNRSHASASENCALHAAHETIDEDEAFSLPPQDSSDDDSDDDEDANTNLSTLRAPIENAFMENAAVEHPPTKEPPKVRFSLENSTSFTADSYSRHSLEPDPDDGTESVYVRRQARKTRTIVDTPDSTLPAENSAVKQPSNQPEVRFSLDTTYTTDSLNHQSLEPDLDESAEFLHVRRQGRKTRAILDTPDAISQRVENNHGTSVGSLENAAFLDTQESARKESAPIPELDDIVCAICGSGASPDEDPIVLCDGPGGGSSVCDLAVHATCYSATIDYNYEWRCDVCLYRFHGGTNLPRCLVCSKHTGALKRLDADDWIHSHCKSGTAPIAAAAASKPRLKKIGRAIKVAREKQEASRKRPALPAAPVTVKPVVGANQKKQRRDYCRFLDDEASIDTNDDMDGDEDEEDLLAIEGEEEKHDGFINDSSQLGEYTQDELDKVDNNNDSQQDVDEAEDATHRAVDAERERMNAFATPLLHRRQKRQHKAAAGNATDSSSSPESSSVPSSERGLGKLHFIRSVMEHHRQGGRAEDIEQFFEELAEEEDESQEEEDDDDDC